MRFLRQFLRPAFSALHLLAAAAAAAFKSRTTLQLENLALRQEYLLRDHDGIFGAGFTKQVADLGIEEVLSAPRSPWQRAYVERVIGTIRRECLDHMIVFHEASLHRYVKLFLAYYHESRTHLSLEKDAPESRPVQAASSSAQGVIPVAVQICDRHTHLSTLRSSPKLLRTTENA